MSPALPHGRSAKKRTKPINHTLSVVTTRKSFPGTKKIAIKAIKVGKALPPRLGLSETVLAFKQPIDFLGGLETFLATAGELKYQAEKAG